MKTRNLLFASAMALSVAAAGCTDASAKLKDASTALISVGNISITKGDLYSLMNATVGTSTVISDATKTISDLEVKVTDDMKANAESTLASYKSMYGDSFTSYLTSAGLTEDDYVNDYLIPSLQSEELPKIYVEQNWDDVVSLYKPVKAIILEFTSLDDANAALSELTDGSATAAEAAANHNSSSTGEESIYTLESTEVDSMVRTFLSNGSTDDGWKLVTSSDGSAYDVAKITEDDPTQFKDDCITALVAIDQVTTDSTTYFFKKYKFHVYDITIYNTMKSDYPDNLVQNADGSAEDVANVVAQAVAGSN